MASNDFILSAILDAFQCAWQGHNQNSKNFICLSGSFRIHYVKIDDWDCPSKDLPIETTTLTVLESKMVHIRPVMPMP
jgi:hypothetical protein